MTKWEDEGQRGPDGSTAGPRANPEGRAGRETAAGGKPQEPALPLRERAERLLQGGPDADWRGGLSEHDFMRLVHELQVHQIELELQNEELRQAQLEPGRARTVTQTCTISRRWATCPFRPKGPSRAPT